MRTGPGGDAGRGHPRPGRRPRAVAALLVAGMLLLAGCATMPNSGPIGKVSDDQAGAAQNAQVRVFPVPPKTGDTPQEMVADFLDAVTSDEADYKTARKYLTASAQQWPYGAGITVLGTTPSTYAVADGKHEKVVILGTEVATVDAHGTYQPISGGKPFTTTFDFVRDPKSGNEWRIDALPAGLILDQLDFQRIYQSINLYFPSSDTGVGGDVEQPVMVPDPVYVRSRIDPITDSAKALLTGPSNWLSVVVGNAFPAGTKLLDDSLAPDANGVVRVHLGQVPGLGSDRIGCREMAAQLLFTLQDASAGSVKSVQVVSGSQRNASCDSSESGQYDADQLLGPGSAYFVGTNGRLMGLNGKEPVAFDAGGPVVPKSTDGGMGTVAVSRTAGNQQVAMVTRGGHDLYVGTLGKAGALGSPWATSTSGSLSTPSWDGTGTLWVADPDPQGPRVLALNDGKAVTVPVDGLSGLPVRGLRVSADGTRIALLVGSAGSAQLELGVIVRFEHQGAAAYTITGLRAIAPQLADVAAVSWADDDSLIVLGKPSGGTWELQYVGVDGSSVADNPTPVPLVEGMTTVAAAEASREGVSEPPLADSGAIQKVIYRLQENDSWLRLSPGGEAPTYPG